MLHHSYLLGSETVARLEDCVYNLAPNGVQDNTNTHKPDGCGIVGWEIEGQTKSGDARLPSIMILGASGQLKYV
jgi:hypothetical protein